MQADAPIVDDACLSFDKDCQPEAAPHGEFIAGGDGTDTCDGDSGGPIYGYMHGRYHLLGITSRAVRPSKTHCGDGGIYIQFDAIAPWVEAQIGWNLFTPDCESLGLNRRPRPENIDYEGVFSRPIRGKILPSDADLEQTHSFEVLTPPQHGTIEFRNNGRFIYRPNPAEIETESPIQDVWWVRVTDSGTPNYSGMARVTLHFTEPRALCAIGGKPTLWWGFWGFIFIAYRHRNCS